MNTRVHFIYPLKERIVREVASQGVTDIKLCRRIRSEFALKRILKHTQNTESIWKSHFGADE
jgi:hypothetical protein